MTRILAALNVASEEEALFIIKQLKADNAYLVARMAKMEKGEK
jgi:hypothetical protein